MSSDKLSKDTMATDKQQLFDKEFRKLVDQCKQVITTKNGASILLSEEPEELKCLLQYFNLYEKMEPYEHYAYFENIFNRHRSAILNCLKDDRWIRTGRIVVRFGEGKKQKDAATAKRLERVCIRLSDIFLMACDLQDEAEKRYEGMTEKEIADTGDQDLVRPSILLLHLVRIWYHLTDGADKAKLGSIVSHLETQLSVQDRTVQAQTKVTSAAGVPPAQNAGATISNLFSFASNLMQQAGIKMPEGITPPTEEQCTSMIQNIFNNENTQKLITGVVSSVNEGGDLQSVVSNVFTGLQNSTGLKNVFGGLQGNEQSPVAAVPNTTPTVVNQIENTNGSTEGVVSQPQTVNSIYTE